MTKTQRICTDLEIVFFGPPGGTHTQPTPYRLSLGLVRWLGAKAALNMMTRTCAQDLAKRCIFMTSVDTGWINDENPLEKAASHASAANFQVGS